MRFMAMVNATKDLEAGVLSSEQPLAAEGLRLEPGKRIRFVGTRRMVSDGPFVETKELVAG